MAFQRTILLLLTLCLSSACTLSPGKENTNSPQVTKKQTSKVEKLNPITLKAYLNQQGRIELELQNTSSRLADGIVIGFRLRYSARIVSNMTYEVTQSIKAGEALIVDTELPLPTERSIIRAEVIKAHFSP